MLEMFVVLILTFLLLLIAAVLKAAAPADEAERQFDIEAQLAHIDAYFAEKNKSD